MDFENLVVGAFENTLPKTHELFAAILKSSGAKNDSLGNYLLAKSHFLLNRPFTAKKLILEQKLDEKFIEAQNLLLDCSLVLGESEIPNNLPTKKIKKIQAFVFHPESVMMLKRGILCLKNSNYEKARNLLVSSLNLDYHCYDALFYLMEFHLLTRTELRKLLVSLKLDKSIRDVYYSMLDGEIREYSECPSVSSYRLEKLVSQNQYTEAKKVAISLFDNLTSLTLNAIHHLIYYYYEAKDKMGLFVLSHELVNMIPNEEVSWYAVGCYYLLAGRNEECRRYFNKATKMNSQYAQAWIGYGHAHSVVGEHDQAISCYSHASVICKSSYKPQLLIAKEYLAMNNLPLAEQYFNLALEGEPDSYDFYNEISVLYFKQKKYEQALKNVNESLKLTKTAEALINQAQILIKTKSFSLARKSLKKAYQMSTDKKNIEKLMGITFHKEKNYEMAIEHYFRAGTCPQVEELMADASRQIAKNEEWIPQTHVVYDAEFDDIDDLVDDVEMNAVEEDDMDVDSE